MADRSIPRFKIISDGLGRNTRLLDQDGNEVLAGKIRSIRWEVEGPGVARIFVELMPAAADLQVLGEMPAVALLEEAGRR